MFSCMSALYHYIPCIQGLLVKCVPCLSVLGLWRYVQCSVVQVQCVLFVKVEGGRWV